VMPSAEDSGKSLLTSSSTFRGRRNEGWGEQYSGEEQGGFEKIIQFYENFSHFNVSVGILEIMLVRSGRLLTRGEKRGDKLTPSF